MKRFKLSEMNMHELDKQALLHTFGSGSEDICVGLDCGCTTLDVGEALSSADKEVVAKTNSAIYPYPDPNL